MIFSVADHIEQIVKGTKTQTRRDSPRYEVNKTYAIQPGRTKPADTRGRILITHKWLEENPHRIHILDAEAEGGYAPDEYEELYEKMHPDWGERIVYEFKFIPSDFLKVKEVSVFGGRVEDIEDKRFRDILMGPHKEGG